MSGRWRRYGVCGLLLLLAGLLAGCGAAARPTPTSLPVSAFPPPIVAPVPAITAITATAAATIARTPTARAPVATPTVAVAVQTNIPAKAFETLRYIRAHNGDPPPGYVGGSTFGNRERRLPPGQYREYDVDPRTGGGRNAERLVIERRSGQAYYTGDHYDTFIPISEGR